MKKLKILLVLFLIFFSTEALSQCTMTVTNINFGAYDVLSTSNLTATGTITVNCARNENITLSIGPSTSGSINPRQMKHVSFNDYLNYNLYQDATYTTIWGDGSQGTTPVIRRVRVRTFTVYGAIFFGQDVSAGQYFDTLTVTVIP